VGPAKNEIRKEDMMRKWKLAGLLGLVLSAWSPSAQAEVITFDQAVDSGTLAYNGTGGSLIGAAIGIDLIVGSDGLVGTLDCVDCELNFATGANTGTEGPPLWNFNGGGTFTITGDAYDGATLVASGTLLAGTFTGNPSVTGGPGLLIAIGFGVDEKNADLLAFYGLSGSTEFTFASTNISASAISVDADGGFTANVNEADVANISRVPDAGSAMAFLGLGLLGVETLRRKMIR
jgi:autotransporter-associated beta strand protein